MLSACLPCSVFPCKQLLKDWVTHAVACGWMWAEVIQWLISKGRRIGLSWGELLFIHACGSSALKTGQNKLVFTGEHFRTWVPLWWFGLWRGKSCLHYPSEGLRDSDEDLKQRSSIARHGANGPFHGVSYTGGSLRQKVSGFYSLRMKTSLRTLFLFSPVTLLCGLMEEATYRF